MQTRRESLPAPHIRVIFSATCYVLRGAPASAPPSRHLYRAPTGRLGSICDARLELSQMLFEPAELGGERRALLSLQ